MSILDNVFGKRQVETRSSADAFNKAFPDNNNPLLNLSKKEILSVNTVFACVNIISSTVASLPFDLYHRTDDGREKAIKHRLYRLTKYPSLDITAYNFMEALLVNLLLYGNAFIEVVKSRGSVKELHLIPSSKININDDGDEVTYTYTSGEESRVVRQSDGILMHIVGKSFNGRKGMSPVDVCLQSIVLSKALETFGLTYFERGARPSGFLKTAKKLSDQAFSRLKQTFTDQYMGSKNSGKMIILEDGMDYETAQNGNDSSQFNETRRFSVEDVARLFNIPLFLLQSTEKSTSWGSGLEQLNLSFSQYCLSPWLKRIEQAYNFFLLSDKEKEDYYFEFNIDGLLRGDQKSRYEAYHIALLDGWVSPNEIRQKENLPDIPNGDVYFRQLNITPYAGEDLNKVLVEGGDIDGQNNQTDEG